MFKTLKIDKRYSFRMDGVCLYKEKPESPPVVVDDEFIRIERDGVIATYNRHFLGLLAHYNVDMDLRLIDRISFNRSYSKVIRNKCGFTMSIWPEIHVGNGFYTIPGLVRYAVNRQGVVINSETGRILSSRIGPYGYPIVAVTDPDKNATRNLCVHILIARTFIPNKDPEVNCYVNHIDGVKTNNTIRNLEWVSGKQNNIHAVHSNLRADNVPTLVKDFLTSEVKRFHSKSEALRYVGLSSGCEIKYFRKNTWFNRTFRGRYQVKVEKDELDWSVNEDGTPLIKPRKVGVYQAKNALTGEIIETVNMAELSKVTKSSLSQLYKLLEMDVPVKYGDYIFRTKLDDPWPDGYIDAKVTVYEKILARNTTTGETKIFDGKRQTCREFGMDKKTLKARLKSGQTYDNYVFEVLKLESPLS